MGEAGQLLVTLARTRTERPETTMILLGLGTTLGCTRWLHREDYMVFERSDDSDGKMEEASVASSRVRTSGEPSQYWLIGFKDRWLEREYLEDLVEVSSSCFFVGSFLTLLLYLALPLAFACDEFVFATYVANLYKPPDLPEVELTLLGWMLLPMIVGGLGFLAAFIVCCVHSMGRWKGRKDVILYVIEGGYLLYTGVLIYMHINGPTFHKGMRTLSPLSPYCFADTLLSV